MKTLKGWVATNMSINSNQKYKVHEKALFSEKQKLGQRIQVRLTDVFVEREPDDEIAQATYSVSRDMSAATLERERKTLTEVEAALKRMEKGGYGRCESCEAAISEARLRALPWARLCISCASGTTASPGNFIRLRKAS
jgi:RNA polymerase-binding protein DksA